MKLTQKERDFLDGLRDKGFVVVTFSPNELGKTNQKELEQELVNYGENKIAMENPED